MEVSRLRSRGTELASAGKPWFLAVNLVIRHDVMSINTDRPGEPVQARNIPGHIVPEPSDSLYSKPWTSDLPVTCRQALDEPGRPPAHVDHLEALDVLVGNIANEDRRWKKRHDLHLNCLRDGMLFCCSMFAYVDGDFLQKAVAVLEQPDGKAMLREAARSIAPRPDLMNVNDLQTRGAGRAGCRAFTSRE